MFFFRELFFSTETDSPDVALKVSHPSIKYMCKNPIQTSKTERRYHHKQRQTSVLIKFNFIRQLNS